MSNNLKLVYETNQTINILEKQKGVSYNYTNFIDHLPRTINQIVELVGNDVVLKGFDVSASLQGNYIKAVVSSGILIQDKTIISMSNNTEIIFPNFQNFSDTGYFVVHTHYQFYEQGQENIFKLGFTYVNQDGTVSGNWYKDKDRIVLDCFRLINGSIVSTFNSDCNNSITIYNKQYFKFGYSYDNITLIDYIRHVVACYCDVDISSGTTSLSVKDESILLSPNVDTINFTGNLVTTTMNGTEAIVNINSNLSSLDFFEYQSSAPAMLHKVIHNKNTMFLKTDVYVYNSITNSWDADNVFVNIIDANTIEVNLVEPANIRVCGIVKSQVNNLIPPKYYEFETSTPTDIHLITHNLDSNFIKCDILVQDPIDNTWSEELITLSIVSPSAILIQLSEPCNIKGFIICKG